VAQGLGASRITVVGHGLGGMVAWTMLSQNPGLLNGVAAISALHPGTGLPARRLLVSPKALAQTVWLRRSSFALTTPKRRRRMKKMLSGWAAQGDWLDPPAWELYQAVLAIPNAAAKSAELLRWILRPRWSAARRRVIAETRRRAQVPVLHIHGEMDHLIRSSAAPEPALGGANYRWVTLRGVGHFAPEEAPTVVNELLLGWLADLPSADL